ncbi:DUF1543 domain-containing protein [Chitiniphilus purpureus]|uniref:DUF1543 domain-containing protein n=1 Tax=Chitiniphilus purpureus TaxID=2981137 RepID=A0ABY6DMR6_9NEIS|nr:DUF1543 domain-containing protein [Chitiniphilus sp. CD1]UXY15631.1 DUF1543 domain-containing protein [Chitiniphilus sp. CD1]
MKLFAVYLGGRAPGCHIELHDVVFAVGERIEDCYPALLAQWFGTAKGLHIDSWCELDAVDGYRIELASTPAGGEPRLFFINLGAYAAGRFTEIHDGLFAVAQDTGQLKRRAKAALLQGLDQLHTDDLIEVDDCLPVAQVGAWHVHLVAGAPLTPLVFHNAYHPIPPAAIAAFEAAASA